MQSHQADESSGRRVTCRRVIMQWSHGAVYSSFWGVIMQCNHRAEESSCRRFIIYHAGVTMQTGHLAEESYVGDSSCNGIIVQWTHHVGESSCNGIIALKSHHAGDLSIMQGS